MTDDKLMERISCFISKHAKNKLMYYAHDKMMTLNRLVGIALDNELMKEKPFDLETDYPDEEYVEYAYVDDAAKIIAYLKRSTGFGLDMLLLMRHDIGIPDKRVFLLAFRECVEKEFLETFIPRIRVRATTNNPEDYVHYRLKKEFMPNEARNKAKKFARDLKRDKK